MSDYDAAERQRLKTQKHRVIALFNKLNANGEIVYLMHEEIVPLLEQMFGKLNGHNGVAATMRGLKKNSGYMQLKRHRKDDNGVDMPGTFEYSIVPNTEKCDIEEKSKKFFEPMSPSKQVEPDFEKLWQNETKEVSKAKKIKQKRNSDKYKSGWSPEMINKLFGDK